MLLQDREWQCKYAPGDGDLLQKFYVPLLRCAVRYDRTTGFYAASTLAAASAGVEALIANGGKMRLIAGCTLGEEEIAAIQRGEKLRDTVEARLLASPFEVEAGPVRDSLELLAWMVARGHLEIKVAVPCQKETRAPFANGEIFHEKAGIVEDAAGARLVFNGSINETLAAWQSRNWDSFHVFCSWKVDAGHLDADEASFQRLWADREPAAIVLGIGEAVKRRLLEFLPPGDDLPRRLQAVSGGAKPPQKAGGQEEEEHAGQVGAEQAQPGWQSQIREAWRFIRAAPGQAPGGDWVGMATAALTPWPHQTQAFRRMYAHWPPHLLIADEVGLGKTIQAGLLIRQAWLAGRAKRILILAPKAVLGQWQLELREKFNLNVPIYDDGKLRWQPTPALPGGLARAVGENEWHREALVLASSQLMRRRERARQLLEEAEAWDLIVLDEAHHARRKASAGEKLKDAPNQLLRLMRKLRQKSRGLLLLTATPMQLHPVEVWDLLNLLGLPEGWSAERFVQFFEDTAHPAPNNALLARAARLFRATEAQFGELGLEQALRLGNGASKFRVEKVLAALREEANTPRNRLTAEERQLALRIMRLHNPIKALISRHTRELLRAYRKAGKLAANIAVRQVQDIMVEMSAEERWLYEAMEDYIASAYNKASPQNQTSVGFVMTIYRRRLASSFFALERTLRGRLALLHGGKAQGFNLEDLPDDELNEEMPEEEGGKREKEALLAEEQAEIEALLAAIGKLPLDSKARRLFAHLEHLREQGCAQVIVFTQYTDTLHYLRKEFIRENPKAGALCFSGRGGESWQRGEWEKISREKTREIFRRGKAEIMFCTDAAAEGLNLQFCGALINYDMPWNPMKVEQRIGRIDRLGQRHEIIRIANFMYARTVEADIYHALRERISLFGAYVGKLQPILAKLPRTFAEITLAGGNRVKLAAEALADMRQEIEERENSGFDLDELGEAAPDFGECEKPAYDLAWLERLLEQGLLPPGHAAAPLSAHKDYSYLAPGRHEAVRVTCDREFYGEHAESVELWSPGSPLFPWEE